LQMNRKGRRAVLLKPRRREITTAPGNENVELGEWSRRAPRKGKREKREGEGIGPFLVKKNNVGVNRCSVLLKVKKKRLRNTWGCQFLREKGLVEGNG